MSRKVVRKVSARQRDTAIRPGLTAKTPAKKRTSAFTQPSGKKLAPRQNTSKLKINKKQNTRKGINGFTMAAVTMTVLTLTFWSGKQIHELISFQPIQSQITQSHFVPREPLEFSF